MVNFDAAPNKTAKIKLDTNAHLESRSDLNVAFSTADQDTAILKFIVTQDNQPLLLGDANIKSNIYLKHSNGSHISHPLTITDGLNGELAFQLPNDFGKIPGKVTAQVYVARKGESQAIVAERIFSFTIQKSLAWEFDAETKLAYIIEFNELREYILNRQKEIEDSMANAEDYVTQLEQAREKGLSDIEIAKTSSLEELNNLADTRLQEINTTGTQYINDLTTVHDGIDGKIDQFNTDVQAEGYIKEPDTVNWQKSKMTQDNGYVQSIDAIDFNDIDVKINKSGFYYAKSVTNGPVGDYQTEGNVTLYKFENNKDRLTFQPRGTHKIFTKYKTGELRVWSDWYDLTYDMETIEGAQLKATQALEEAKVYTDEKIVATHKILFSGSVNGTGNVINLDESFYDYEMVVISGSWSGGTFYEVVIPQLLGSTINVQKFNLINSSGNLDSFYELTLSISSGIKITIDKDVSYDFSSGKGNSSRNSFTIAQIEGFN